MSSRERILAALRANKAPFADAPQRPPAFMPVTRFDSEDLLARFTAELERLTGKVHVTADISAALTCVLDLLGDDKAILAWADLPDMGPALAAHSIQIQVPQPRTDRSDLAKAEPVRVGITGANAAFAATGTLALVTSPQHGRIPSLLPPVHIALLRRNRIFARLEDWLAQEGRQALLDSNSIALITGPSRTGDIEMQSILGVHGPGVIHVVVW